MASIPVDVRGVAAFRSREFPRAAHVASELLEKARTMLGGQVLRMDREHGTDFWREAERLLRLTEDIGGPPTDSLIEYTTEYLKAQAQYLTSHEYTHSSFDTAYEQVYNNPEVMSAFYLKGLLLTHAFWPIHYDIHRFFQRAFLPRVPNHGCGAEFGYGHGLYLLDILTARPGTVTRSYDISRYSMDFASRLLATGSIAPARYQLGLHDIRQPLPEADGSLAWAVFAEVLEHIPNPEGALRELRRCLQTGAPLFATTVLYSNAIDHLYQFANQAAVRAMLQEAGFTVVAEQAFRVADYAEKTRDPSIDVVFVCTAGPGQERA